MTKLYLLFKNIFTYYLSIKFKSFLIFRQKLGIIKLKKRFHNTNKYFYEAKLKKDWILNYNLNNTINLSLKDALYYLNKNSGFINNTNINIGLSTGTTGSPTPFLSTENDRLNWFFAIYIRLFPLSYFRPIKISFFLKYNNILYTETSKNSIINIKYFDANLDISDYLESLLVFDPEVIVAPPQILKKIVSTNLNFPNLKKFISVTEKLDFIDKIFFKNIKLKEIYQATEGFIGVSCSKGNIHLNEDLMIIEKYCYYYYDKKYFFPVITDFKREGQTISRLILDDLLEFKPTKCHCNCNFMSIASIDSRLSDLVVTFYNDHFYIIPANILNKVLLIYLDCENDYKLIQIKVNLFIISTLEDIQIKIRNNIKNEIQKIMNTEIKIFWRIHYKKNTTFSKMRRVKSLIKKEIKLLSINDTPSNSIILTAENSNMLIQNKNFNTLPNCAIIITT